MDEQLEPPVPTLPRISLRRRRGSPVELTAAQLRAIWLRAQRLDTRVPFGEGPEATRRAVAHLGYVQIDTINVIERSHHHILHNRIPSYARSDLERAQSGEKSVFEYWTHALAYVAVEDYRFFLPEMERRRALPSTGVAEADHAALLARIRREGPLSIRDIDDEVLVEKTHPWDSRKPSRRVLRHAFYAGDLVVSRRVGMLKTYELTNRHFGWRRRPKPATEAQIADYLLRRAVVSQGVVSLDSICYGRLSAKPAVAAAIETAVRRRRLVPVQVEGAGKVAHWAAPEALEVAGAPEPLVHILSPFDPLVIQRRRLEMFFGYAHRFEAYVPAEKRVQGYFALPVLAGDEIVAAIDLKTDRQEGRLLIRKWSWIAPQRAGLKAAIEAALAPFERFQLSPAAREEAG
ncbi:winged helix-turn-helix domain-containing protein [Roseococcus pinisoli]|uniref:YcaQ family DNA glycosylase n=1 Tax=Roseococcus pinisoli TaxID=2835040 RepID=A0ABS5QHR7_9PROT|nr:crosslink repair DNA glycosylase YcaQ family protein [Roseococcus pinisoli]MBS7812088.1 YcaQ family DNA glycosylase [Roseococcus pinisoli]